MENMYSEKSERRSLALFCKVVDNYGDVGICWRLSQQLSREHDIAVTLWIDDLNTLQRLWPETVINTEMQVLAGVTVRYWQSTPHVFHPNDIADIVIEFFGCEIPEAYVAAMAQCTPPPVWLNLEGLTAEKWVEGCHTLPSPHPRFPLTKYFFFPGFAARTGGLIRERSLLERRRLFEVNRSDRESFLRQLGVIPVEAQAKMISLFCYPHAPVTALFEAWQDADSAITCLVPEGVAVDAIQAFLGAPVEPGAVRTRGALTVRVLPFVAQPDYDKLLWVCDVNFVRGEDSFVRAQCAGKPFLWHIYPQDKNLQHVKLRAFLQRYADDNRALVDASLHWNDAVPPTAGPTDGWPGLWRRFELDALKITSRSASWTVQMQAHGEMTMNMLKFAAAVASKNTENPL